MNHPKNLFFFFFFKNVHHVRVNETTENKPGVYHYTVTSFIHAGSVQEWSSVCSGSPSLCRVACSVQLHVPPV